MNSTRSSGSGVRGHSPRYTLKKDRTTVVAVKKRCPKRSQVWLMDKKGKIGCLRTTCKTKSCRVCGPKRALFFAMLVEFGMRFSTDHAFYFITLTYKASVNLQRDASAVRDDWRAWLEWWNARYPEGMWVRALELTKRKQPHLHLIASFGPGIKPRARCEQRARYNRRWRAKVCDCLEHRLSVVWNGIVPDSYVVDAREALTEDASYLAKYVGKANQISSDMVELGFKRTWSRSRSWPVERFHLVATMEKSWRKISIGYPGDWKEMAHSGMSTGEWIRWTDEHPFESSGTDLNWAMEVEHEKKRAVSEAKRIRKEILSFDYQAKNNRNEIGAGRAGSRGSVVSDAGRQQVAVRPGRAARDRGRGSADKSAGGVWVLR